MDDKKPDHLKSVPPSLTAAIRRARVEAAEQNEAVADLREAEIARLQLLEEAVRPVLDQTPAAPEDRARWAAEGAGMTEAEAVEAAETIG